MNGRKEMAELYNKMCIRDRLQAVAEKAMSFATAAEVEAYMKEFMEKMTD